MAIIDATLHRDFALDPEAQGTTGALIYHFHEAYELLYLISGHLQFFIGDRLYAVSPGDAILIPKNTLHKCQNTDSVYQRIVWNFTDAFLDDALIPHIRTLCQTPVYHPSSEYMQDMIRKFKTELQREERGDSLAPVCYRHYLNLLLTHFIRNQEQYRVSDSSVANPTIDRVVRYIKEHYSEPITREFLADMLHVSPGYLSRIFIKTTGLHFREYLIGVRIQHACDLLEYTDLSIHAIAARCGFDDSNYFSSVFKNIVGLSPRQYKKRDS